MIAYLADEGGECEKGAQRIIPVASDHWFESVPFDSLCRLEYQTNPTMLLLAFSLDRLGLIALKEGAFGWRVPLPLDQRSDRRYALIAIFDDDNVGFEAALQKQLLRWGLLGKRVQLSDVSVWVEKQSIKANIYGHVLSRSK